ncbi:YetF domain-containing protein [Pseudobacteroides cellulosolvens]|uniref:DUF421 domain-containing protein n=1 Tax=Pseudobacteroides cellulosolvens ATCC 35603 = DSM 2933 TaxID=398512 RepID=A0A0L6JN09_9FIRM|nr:DUF421 domain-containing protein [Pseudobacteroides cellulosolvens]KNY27178.1 protein of unknown function DUF421 [Pseudobacteroides cellulosolvens ATCC 35603 = DSM 2933]
MFQEVLYTSARIFVAYFLLLSLTRIMGRKMISQITFFDFVVGVIVGSVAANISVSQQNPVLSGVTVLVVLALITVTIDSSNIKSIFTRKLTNSEPVTVVENGKIIAENLKRTRLPLDNLMMLLREKNTFNIADVEFAIFETDGKLSVLKKSQKQPITPSDLNISTAYAGLTKDIIIDGKVMDENLKDANLDREWLIQKLRYSNFNSIEEVFYAGLDTSGNLYISSKNRTKEKEGQHGIE